LTKALTKAFMLSSVFLMRHNSNISAKLSLNEFSLRIVEHCKLKVCCRRNIIFLISNQKMLSFLLYMVFWWRFIS